QRRRHHAPLDRVAGGSRRNRVPWSLGRRSAGALTTRLTLPPLCGGGTPRWLYTPVYRGLGWVAVFYLGAILDNGGPAVVTLLAIGGAAYTAGGIVYAIKRPTPSPRWFGFHEVFHALTLIAFIAHYVAISLVTYNAVGA